MSIHKPDAICIFETWLCPDNTAAEISLPGAVRLDRDRHSGGIILIVADVYSVKVLQQGPLDLEFLLGSVQCAQFKLSLAVPSSFSLIQVVPSPIHTTSCTDKSTLIDLALVSSPGAVDYSVIPPIGNSVHLSVQESKICKVYWPIKTYLEIHSC